ncbi:hypothetical protein GGI64_001936 [Rhizobium leguminosarum]|uniref:Uncharacterized protein n=1 Tax=Rhizobium leguminosarum TaxID=384 RepID=A0A7Z0DXL2_RHILE|nr:hypothetical protein [Rhizobium leguminosarum]NYJ10889.1 hypothetical protein [Rhizobium leguminosarum]
MAANSVLNSQDGFELNEVDHAICANDPTQLVGRFLIDANRIVRWVQIEARDGPNNLSIFPNEAERLAAAGRLRH